VRKLQVVAVLLVLLTPVSESQTISQNTKTPEALERLRVAIRANVGDTKLADTVTHATLRDAASTNPVERSFTLTTKGNSSTKLSDGVHNTVLRSGKTERQDDQGTLKRVRDPNAQSRRIEHLPVLFLREVLENDDYRCIVVAAHDGIPEHLSAVRMPKAGIVDERLARNRQTDIYIDADTLLVSKISFVMVSTTDWRRTVAVEIVYEDYRDLKGVKVPFKQTKYVAGQFHSELVLRDAAFDTGITEIEFNGGTR
jgi:hypothetical protein